MTLSEFDRRCRGHHRRRAEQWRHTRLQAVIFLNAHRGEHDAALTPQEFMPLPGDARPEAPLTLSPEQVETEYARAASLDADLN